MPVVCNNNSLAIIGKCYQLLYHAASRRRVGHIFFVVGILQRRDSELSDVSSSSAQIHPSTLYVHKINIFEYSLAMYDGLLLLTNRS